MTNLTAPNAHGDLGCLDVESLLTEVTGEAAAKGDRLADMEAKFLIATRDADQARREAARAQALISEIRVKFQGVSEAKGALSAQVDIIMSEMDAMEEAALPLGTFTHAVVSDADILATYRQVTRIRRGPMPQAMAARVAGAQDQISQAMSEAGAAVVEDVIRKETRRARRATQRSAARRRHT
ncbi:MAG: hypothetical protein ACOH1Y_12510 [Propionicimonas sp.]